MECPNCKLKTLVPARTSEASQVVDGMKCTHCDQLFRWNASHHLVPYDPLERPILPQITYHIPAAHIPDKKVPAADPPAARDLVPARDSAPPEYVPQKTGSGHRLTPEQREEVKRRILAGEKVWDVAHHFGVTDWAIYIYRKKLGIRGRTRVKVKPGHIKAKGRPTLTAKSEDLPPPARYLAIRTIIIQKAANGFILELRREEGEFDPVKDLRIFPDFKTVVDWLQG